MRFVPKLHDNLKVSIGLWTAVSTLFKIIGKVKRIIFACWGIASFFKAYILFLNTHTRWFECRKHAMIKIRLVTFQFLKSKFQHRANYAKSSTLNDWIYAKVMRNCSFFLIGGSKSFQCALTGLISSSAWTTRHNYALPYMGVL